MPADITASLVVSFKSADGDGLLSADIDSRSDGFNNGDTSFSLGDSPAYLVVNSSNVVIEKHCATSNGPPVYIQDVVIEFDGLVNFINSNTATLSHPVNPGTFSYESLGEGCDGIGVVSLIGERTLKSTNKGTGILRVKYSYTAHAYRINNVSAPQDFDGDEFAIIIYLKGKVA